MSKGEGTVIYSTRGDGTHWVHTIQKDGSRVGHMVSSDKDRKRAKTT